jgi:hypothetical protein
MQGVSLAKPTINDKKDLATSLTHNGNKQNCIVQCEPDKVPDLRQPTDVLQGIKNV